MKKFYLILLTCYYCCYEITTAQNWNENRISALAESVNSFGYSLYKTVNVKIDGNFVISPFSTATMLSIVYLGSQGRAEKQLKKTLKLAIKYRHLPRAFESYLNRLTNHKSNNVIEFAHLIFMNDRLNVNAAYQTMLNRYFSSNVISNNFINETKWINSRIHGRTNNRIKTLIPQGVVNSKSTVLLTDAFYFAGSWIKPFTRDNTVRKKFYIKKGKTMNVMSMHLVAKLERYKSSDPKCDILELPLESSFSLYVILPEKGADIVIFEDMLTTSLFETIVNHAGFEKKLITVDLPKFHMSTRIGMKPFLRSLGIRDLFDKKRNNFSRVIKGPMKAYVDKAVQKTVVKFEEGESKDSFNVHKYGCHNPFNVDHPFIFLVVDKIAKMILFMGRIVDPNARYFYGPI